MEWIWVGFGALGAYLVTRIGIWSWRAPQRWLKQGIVDNGLGTRLVIEEDPRRYRIMAIWMRVYAAFAFAMAVGLVAITLGWIGKAL